MGYCDGCDESITEGAEEGIVLGNDEGDNDGVINISSNDKITTLLNSPVNTTLSESYSIRMLCRYRAPGL